MICIVATTISMPSSISLFITVHVLDLSDVAAVPSSSQSASSLPSYRTRHRATPFGGHLHKSSAWQHSPKTGNRVCKHSSG